MEKEKKRKEKKREKERLHEQTIKILLQPLFEGMILLWNGCKIDIIINGKIILLIKNILQLNELIGGQTD